MIRPFLLSSGSDRGAPQFREYFENPAFRLLGLDGVVIYVLINLYLIKSPVLLRL